MIEELEKQIAWQNINTSEEKNKILSGKAIAIETEKVKLTNKDGKMTEENITCIIINFNNIKVLIPSKELGIEKEDKKTIRNLIGAELKFIIIESDKLTNTAVASRIKAMNRIKDMQLKKYEQGDIIYAKIISVWNKYIIVECLGLDIKLNISDLEYGYVTNLSSLYQIGDKIDVVGTLEINEFNGRQSVQINLKDLRKSY